jgi:mannosylglycerate hydrolase
MPIIGHIISHTHWDREWFLTSKYTAEWLVPFFTSLLNMLDQYSQYCFVLDGQTIMIEDYLDQLPPSERSQSEKKIKQYIGQSRLQVGPYYLQPDWRLVSGESLVRNMLLGHQMANELGNVMKVGWLLDNFGQISQAPQIHEGFGIKGVFLWRGIEVNPEQINSEYLWESPDGSQVTSIYLLNSYRNAMRLAEYADIAYDRLVNETRKLTRFATTDNVLLMNGYDQEMVPDDILPLLERFNANSNGMQLIQTTPNKYLEAIQKDNPSLQILKGAQNSGRYISIFPGTLSARMYLKQMNSTCENLLTKWAEPMSVWLWLLGGKYPKTSIDYAWKELLQNHPHDNICGVSIDDVHSDMEDRFRRSKEASEIIVEHSLITITGNINTEHERNLVVFNPSPWKREGIVKMAVQVEDDFSIHETETGKAVPYQIGNKKGKLTYIYFFTDSIPGVGYKTFYVGNKRIAPSLPDIVTASAEDCSMENKHLKVRIENNGSVTVTDKTTGRQFNSLAYFEDGADSGDTYNYSYPHQDLKLTSLNSKAHITLIDQGPLLARFKIELTMNLPVSLLYNRKKRSKRTRLFPIVTYVKLEANSSRLDFYTRLKNVVKDHRLRVVFPTFLETKYSFSDRPFSVDESPVSFSSYPQELPDKIKQIMIGARESVPGSSLPLNSFVYLKDDQNGSALLTRGLTEYEITDKHKIALTLFRAVGWLARNDLLTRVGDAGPMIFTPEAQCLRYFDFYYSFLPFHNKTNGFLFKQAEEFNIDLKAVSTTKHKGNLENKRGLLFLDSDNDSLVISAIKKCESEDKLILRLYNSSSQEANGVLTFDGEIQQAETVNLNEEFQSNLSIKKNAIAVKVLSKKIVTVNLKFKQSKPVKNIQSSGIKILSPHSVEKTDDLNVNIPAIVTKNDIIRERKRAKQIKKELLLNQINLKEVKSKIVSSKNGQESSKLERKKIYSWGKVTTLVRSELEARLSFILTEKKYNELYESDKQKKNKKIKTYDSIIRDIGFKLNTARVNKRAAEYLIEFYNSRNKLEGMNQEKNLTIIS